jgi:competence protein ComGC
MDLRTTSLLFGLLLGILWLFGLMLVYKKTAPDDNLIVPSMHDAKIDLVTIEKEGKEAKDKLVFTQINELWYLQQHDQKVRVEGFKIDQMIKETQGARRYEEERVSEDLAEFGLAPPQMVVTFKGTVRSRDKEWQLKVGKEMPSKFLVYVNSSDPKKSAKAFPVVRTTLDSLFFKNVAALRSQRLFDIIEPSVTSLYVKEGDKKLLLKKSDSIWRFEIPKLGIADIDSPGAADAKNPAAKAGGVKGLIVSIGAIHVDGPDDFVPLGADLASYGVADGKETMRIELGSGVEKSDKDKKGDKDAKEEKDKKDSNKEVLLIGKKFKQGGIKKNEIQYYARLLSDQGVFRINEKMLEAVKQAVENPEGIRSHDVAVFETKNADAIVINTTRKGKDAKGQDASVKEKIELLHPDKEWLIVAGVDKPRKANDKTIEALLDTLHGTKAIKEFADGKDDSWGGLNGVNVTEIGVYLNAVEKDKKDDKKAAKKDAKTDKKDAKKGDKKDDKKEDAPPSLKTDAKPVVKLFIGTVDKDKKIAHVKRVLQDGSESRFTVDAAFVDKLHLDDPALAFLDPVLPQPKTEVVALDIKRGKEDIKLDRDRGDLKFNRWLFSDGKPADQAKLFALSKDLVTLQARKWVRNDGSDKYGFKEAQTSITIFAKPNEKQEERLAALSAASVMGTLIPGTMFVPVPSFGPTMATRIPDPGDKKLLSEQATITFGNEIDQDKEKLVYVKHSGTDLIALVPVAQVKPIRDADLRDRSAVLHTQAQLDALFLGLTCTSRTDPTVLAWPLVSGTIHNFDPAKATEVSIVLRTRVDRRTFKFQRTDKDKEKTWTDQSGVEEFHIDPDKIKRLLDQFSKLRTERFASFAGPDADNKLADKDATLRIEVTFEDKSTVTLTIGAAFGPAGYFATSSAWPDTVFFLSAATVDPWLQGATYFGKERVAAAP